MTALRRYLPLLNALSASSPFSAGRETGFKSYRLNLLSVVPRFGLPPAFSSRRDYESLLEACQSLKFIEDGSEFWWDLRPSPKYPTIELRICDICTRLDDVLAVAAVYASLIRKLLRQDAPTARCHRNRPPDSSPRIAGWRRATGCWRFSATSLLANTSTLTIICRHWSRISPRMPRHSTARTNCAILSRSSETAPARIGNSITFGCAG